MSLPCTSILFVTTCWSATTCTWSLAFIRRKKEETMQFSSWRTGGRKKIKESALSWASLKRCWMTRPSLREKVIINKSNSTWLFPASRTGVIFFFGVFQVSAIKRKGAWHAIRARLALACTRLKNTHTKEQKSKTNKFSCCTGVVFPNMQKDSNEDSLSGKFYVIPVTFTR